MPDFRANSERIKSDLGHAINGDFGRISETTRREIAETVRDHMEGRNRVDIPINDRVTIGGRRERDGTIIGSIRFDF